MGLHEAQMHEAAARASHAPVCAARYMQQAWKKTITYSFSLLVSESAPISVKEIKSPEKKNPQNQKTYTNQKDPF